MGGQKNLAEFADLFLWKATTTTLLTDKHVYIIF
jgi:hypothetical protein